MCVPLSLFTPKTGHKTSQMLPALYILFVMLPKITLSDGVKQKSVNAILCTVMAFFKCCCQSIIYKNGYFSKVSLYTEVDY